MTPEHVCTVLGISRGHLARLIRSGEMPALRIGWTAIVREKDLAQYIASGLPGREQDLVEQFDDPGLSGPR